ncbi:hypothetical protein K439DRAFT_1611654 [Ramaria rubella]|nr:hypothetical protein K439DRAFT_1611654 [Ramaria rubella]
MSTPSVRAAALAFALSSWVEGLTQLRTVLLIPSLRREDEEDIQEPTSLLSSNATWRDRIVAWFKRNGRRDLEIDDTERTSLGAVHIATAFVVLQMLQQPLLPFILSPFLTTLPLPRSTSGFKPIKWPHLVLTTILLSLLHEAERVSVFIAVDTIKKRRDAKNMALLGEVYVRGDELRIREADEDDEEAECLICAGGGADTSLSQSISSFSSVVPPLDVLGPLEAFCATAPQKHVAHRSCFLSWHAAYRQQRMHLAPEYVELQHSVPTNANRKRAQSILEAAGFAHLGRLVRFPHELPWTRTYPPTLSSGSRSPIRPTLTLTENTAGPSSLRAGSCTSLATLHTTTPPCPGCRSSVLLHFFSRALAPSLNQGSARTRLETIQHFTRLWVHHWCKLVTGRTVVYRLVSQWSFVMALLSMIRVSRTSTRSTFA